MTGNRERSRRSTVCLAALVVLAACGKLRPLAVDGGTGALDGASDRPDGSRSDGAAALVEGGTSVDTSGDATSDAIADAPVEVRDAAVDATDGRVAADGARVPYRAIAVTTGEVQSCALLEDHNVKCWGHNSFGELGYGDQRERGLSPSDMGDALPTVDLGTGRTAIAIGAGRYTTCALLDDGSLRCWGWSGLGGEGATSDVGDEPGEMGDHLKAVDFGGRKAVHFGLGDQGACASTDDDTIWCWWEGGTPQRQAQLPLKHVQAWAPAQSGVVALYDDGTLSPVLPGGTTSLTFARKVVAVAGGAGDDTCVLFDDRTTACTFGAGDPVPGPTDVVAIGSERFGGPCDALSNGTVTCRDQQCTQPTYYQCSGGSFKLHAAPIAVTNNGSSFACALLADGTVQCWGDFVTMPPPSYLGASVDYTQTDGGITYGAWRTVDLGTHP